MTPRSLAGTRRAVGSGSPSRAAGRSSGLAVAPSAPPWTNRTTGGGGHHSGRKAAATLFGCSSIVLQLSVRRVGARDLIAPRRSDHRQANVPPGDVSEIGGSRLDAAGSARDRAGRGGDADGSGGGRGRRTAPAAGHHAGPMDRSLEPKARADLAPLVHGRRLPSVTGIPSGDATFAG